MAVYPWVQEEASAVGQLRCAVAGLCQIHHLVKQDLKEKEDGMQRLCFKVGATEAEGSCWP